MQSAQPRLNSRRQKLARQYGRQARRLSFIQSGIVAAIFLWLVFGGLSVKLSRILEFPQPWASSLYFIILMIGLGIILIPINYYQGFILPRRYGLSHQNFKDWLVDRAKASALSFLIGLATVILIYWLLTSFPTTWWLWAAIILFLLSLFLSRLTPTLLLSMFFKLEPLADKQLKKRLTNLARRARTSIVGVFTINMSSKSTTANAMLAGWGRTRRIVLTDTMLQKYTTDEIEVVLAHELGHHLHRDIPKLIAIQVVMIFLSLCLSNLVLKAGVATLGFQSTADAAGLPLLFLFVATLAVVITPLTNAYSRRVEIEADKAALDLTTNLQAFIGAMTRLTNQNLSVADPDRWVELLFYDHPPYTKRVKLARHYCLDNLADTHH
jgi:Zn-dependent protease with chaperone function